MISSANRNVCALSFRGVSVSLTYMANSVGERDDPCGTPALDEKVVDLVFLWRIVYVLFRMKFDNSFLVIDGILY